MRRRMVSLLILRRRHAALYACRLRYFAFITRLYAVFSRFATLISWRAAFAHYAFFHFFSLLFADTLTPSL